MMLEELVRRNYAQTTIDCYIGTVAHFSRYFNRPPDQLGTEHIREYQAALFTKFKLAPNTVNQRLAALRFYVKTLKKGWSAAETPYPKKVLNLPMILSQEEVARLIDSALTPLHRILLMTLYSTGMRRAELTRLKITDVDSQRMVIHIRGDKGAEIATSCSAPYFSQPCANTGMGWSANHRTGYSSVRASMTPFSPFPAKRSITHTSMLRDAPVSSRKTFTRTA
jgi:site-specific recombinase XerD